MFQLNQTEHEFDDDDDPNFADLLPKKGCGVKDES